MSMTRILLDLTDLREFFEGNRAPMGVPRVQTALLEGGLSDPSAPLFEPMGFDAQSGRFRAAPPEAVLDLLSAARLDVLREDPHWIEARRRFDATHRAAPEMAFAPGDVVFTPGQPFQVPGQMRRLRELRRAHGVVLGALFYDAIPLMVPEHCGPELTAEFARNLVALCLQVDRVVAISAYAARDLRDWQRRIFPALDLPIGLMPLDAPFATMAEGPPPPLPSPLDDGRPFVLCVSTLESRKNQALVLHAWLTLLRRHGENAVPRLVLVGRAGFGADPALRLLDHAPELRRNAVWLRHVPDGVLARLYRDCLFTVFNSFYEGWGLPVTEALSHGKLVLAPDHTSLREAGGSAALYFTPQSEPELAGLAWDLIRDPTRRQALEAALPGKVRLRSWRAVAEGLVAELARPQSPLPDPLSRAGSFIGRRITFDAPPPGPDFLLTAFPDLDRAAAGLLLEGEGWGLAEAIGTWLTSGSATLRLPALEGQGMRLFLEMTGPPPGGETGMRLVTPDGVEHGWRRVTFTANERRFLEFVIPPGPAGDAVLEFDTAQAQPVPGDDRALSLLLHGLMLCADHDLQRAYEYLGDRLHLVRLA